jgi:hypothetical protein
MTVKEQKRPWYGQHGVNGPRAYGKIIRKGQAVRERAERKTEAVALPGRAQEA